jgi:hypothetical protein
MRKAIRKFVLLCAGMSVLAPGGREAMAHPKPDPSGIVRLFNESVAKPENNAAWTNPNIDGMRARLPWSHAQPEKQTFEWTDIDETLHLATR